MMLTERDVRRALGVGYEIKQYPTIQGFWDDVEILPYAGVVTLNSPQCLMDAFGDPLRSCWWYDNGSVVSADKGAYYFCIDGCFVVLSTGVIFAERHDSKNFLVIRNVGGFHSLLWSSVEPFTFRVRCSEPCGFGLLEEVLLRKGLRLNWLSL